MAMAVGGGRGYLGHGGLEEASNHRSEETSQMQCGVVEELCTRGQHRTRAVPA